MLTGAGINYICINFGSNDCCVASGLSWVLAGPQGTFQETGGTAQIVARLVVGLFSITMTNPPGTQIYTQARLNEANGSIVTLADAAEITYHDEPNEDQWCLVPVTPPPTCSDINNEVECLNMGCYWWNGSCHADPPRVQQRWTLRR